MSCILRLVGIAGIPGIEVFPEQDDPQWLAWFDVDAHGGIGEVRSTRDRACAQRFATAIAAIEAWRTQSTARPLRPDGKPNRPLTAYTVEVEHDD